jgi:hypothetical protein
MSSSSKYAPSINSGPARPKRKPEKGSKAAKVIEIQEHRVKGLKSDRPTLRNADIDFIFGSLKSAENVDFRIQPYKIAAEFDGSVIGDRHTLNGQMLQKRVELPPEKSGGTFSLDPKKEEKAKGFTLLQEDGRFVIRACYDPTRATLSGLSELCTALSTSRFTLKAERNRALCSQQEAQASSQPVR